jgi:hypothetical protein
MKLRRLGLTVAASALALTAFAGTASAATPGATVNVAHGIPGVKVDVCVAGSAVKKDFKYGQKFQATLPAGTYTIRVRAAAHAATCRGTVLIKQSVTLTDGLNATAVANYVAGKPALSIFVNDLTVPSPDKATITVRHTAKAPTVDVWLNGGTAPAIENLARQGSVGPVAVDAAVYSWWVSADGGYAPVIGPRVAELKAGRAYQILAVGTKPANYRFIVISQAGTIPS